MMFSQKRGFFSRIAKSYPILKLLDLYDPKSFIRESVLDNIFVCMFMYFVFYIGLWYADKVIKQIEKTNEEMLMAIKENRTKLEDVITLKNKRAEYEEIVVKSKGVQKVTAKHLDSEMKRLSSEMLVTGGKIGELEKILGKFLGSALNARLRGAREGESPEGIDAAKEDFKVLVPSFPPPQPPEPPPRKYGIFVTRPPGQRPPSHGGSPVSPATPPPKIGFK